MTTIREATRLGRLHILLVLIAFLVLAFAGSVINPLHEATDELRHYRFVQHLVQLRRLPVQGEMACQAQGHHPPLFYALGALATFWIDTGREVCSEPPTNPFWQYRYWEVGQDNKNQYLHGADEAFPWQGEALAAHLVRIVNILLGAGVVLLTWIMGRVIWPSRPSIALGATAFVAFNPMFVYMAGAINNDIIAALTGTAVTLACVVLVQESAGLSRRWGVVLGLLYGLALLSKFNLAAVGVLIGTAVTWVAWRKKQWRLWLEVAFISLAVTLLLAGWWFVRNQMLYGEPTGFERLTELWGVRNPAESFGLAVYELDYTWTSLWGRFGYGQVPLPDAIYLGLRWLVGFGLVGLLVPVGRRQWERLRPVMAPLLLLGLDVILFFGVLFNYLLVSPAGAMGRFFFPALPALALLTAFGLLSWGDWLAGRRGERGLAIGVTVAMAGLTAVALWGYLQPAFARPPAFGPDTAVPNPLGAQFDSLFILRGYELSRDTLSPGDVLSVDLYWEVIGEPPGNFLLFTHLIDEDGLMVTQRDTHPGLGNFPTGEWQVGDRFVDTVRLHMPETLYAPGEATLSLGFYAPEGYRLGVTAVDGSGLGDALVLDTLALKPAAGDTPNPLDVNFNDSARLRGYAYHTRLLQPGEPLDLTLYWQVIQPPEIDYQVQVWLCEDPCEKWQPPQAAALFPFTPAPTSWSPSQTVTHTLTLPIPPEVPAGDYFIHVALIDPMTKDPQNILAEDGHILEDRLLLSRVRVMP